MSYGNFIRLASNAECVLTDGGSNQEELAFLGIPTIVMRDYTERQDGIAHNAIMEGSLSEGVFAFLQNHGYKNLKKKKLFSKAESPSESIVRFMKNLSKADNTPL
jgi:UDP-N-acetylglucosamine 2-epimerase (non-hydrolysing)